MASVSACPYLRSALGGPGQHVVRRSAGRAGEGYEVVEKQAAAAGRLRKKPVPLLGARSLAASVIRRLI